MNKRKNSPAIIALFSRLRPILLFLLLHPCICYSEFYDWCRIPSSFHYNLLPDAAYSPATDKSLVVWEDASIIKSDAKENQSAIRGQFLDTNGQTLSPPFYIAGGASGDGNDSFREPKVAAGTGDYWLVVCSGSGPFGNDIRVFRVDADGTVTFLESMGRGLLERCRPDIGASINDGRFLIVWERQLFIPSVNTREIVGRYFGANGSESNEFRVSDEFEHARNPSVNQRGANYLVAWESGSNGEEKIRGSYFSSATNNNGSGPMDRGPYLVIADTETNTNPSVAGVDQPGSSEYWAVTWQKTLNPDDEDIYVAFLDSAETGFSFPVESSLRVTTRPSVTWSGDDINTFFVSYGSAESWDDSFDIAGRRVSRTEGNGAEIPIGAGGSVEMTMIGGTYGRMQSVFDDGQGFGFVFGKAFETVPNQPPEQPSFIPPIDPGFVPLLEASAYSESEGDAHARSHWQISTTDQFVSGSITWSHPDDSDNDKTRQAVPFGVLSGDTVYYCRVRYQDARGGWSSWSEPVSFATESAPSITIVAPVDQDEFTAGDWVTVSWTSEGNVGSYFVVDLIRDGIIHDTLKSGFMQSGTTNVRIPTDTPPAEGYSIRVSSAGAIGAVSASELFRIAMLPRLTMVSPNGGESFVRGETVEILWTSEGNVGDIVDLWLNDGSWRIAEGIPNDGRYLWTVGAFEAGSAPLGYYKIRIQAGSVIDRSDDIFKITGNLAVGPTEISVGNSGGQVPFSVTSNASWEALTSTNWLWNSDSSRGNTFYGNGNGERFLAIHSNIDPGQRTGTVDFTLRDDSSVTVSVLVTQSGDDFASSFEDAPEIALGSSVSGYLVPDDIDMFKFRVSETGILKLTVENAPPGDDAPMLKIYNAAREVVGGNLVSPDTTSIRRFDFLRAGEYYIEVKENSESGGYRLSTHFASADETIADLTGDSPESIFEPSIILGDGQSIFMTAATGEGLTFSRASTGGPGAVIHPWNEGEVRLDRDLILSSVISLNEDLVPGTGSTFEAGIGMFAASSVPSSRVMLTGGAGLTFEFGEITHMSFSINPLEDLEGIIHRDSSEVTKLSVRLRYEHSTGQGFVEYMATEGQWPDSAWRSLTSFDTSSDLSSAERESDFRVGLVAYTDGLAFPADAVILESFSVINASAGGDHLITDVDKDGMDDDWEKLHFGSLDANPLDDSDGDGRTNADEEISGTDPKNSSSLFRILTVDIEEIENRFSLTWDSVVGKSYRVERSYDGVFWEIRGRVLATDIESDFSEIVHSEDFGNTLLYRIAVE